MHDPVFVNRLAQMIQAERLAKAEQARRQQRPHHQPRWQVWFGQRVGIAQSVLRSAKHKPQIARMDFEIEEGHHEENDILAARLVNPDLCGRCIRPKRWRRTGLGDPTQSSRRRARIRSVYRRRHRCRPRQCPREGAGARLAWHPHPRHRQLPPKFRSGRGASQSARPSTRPGESRRSACRRSAQPGSEQSGGRPFEHNHGSGHALAGANHGVRCRWQRPHHPRPTR